VIVRGSVYQGMIAQATSSVTAMGTLCAGLGGPTWPRCAPHLCALLGVIQQVDTAVTLGSAAATLGGGVICAMSAFLSLAAVSDLIVMSCSLYTHPFHIDTVM